MAPTLIPRSVRVKAANAIAGLGLAAKHTGNGQSCTQYERCRAKAIEALVGPDPTWPDMPKTVPGLAAENTSWGNFAKLTQSLPPRVPADKVSREGLYTGFYERVGADALTEAASSVSDETVTPLDLAAMATFAAFGGADAVEARKQRIQQSNLEFLEEAAHHPELRAFLQQLNEPGQE